MNDLGIITLGGKRGGFAIVDADLFPELNKFKWIKDRNGYVFRNVWQKGWNSQKKTYLHRVVNQTPEGMETDHVNHCLHDCTRRNLRTSSRAQNNANHNKVRRACLSKYKGVSFVAKGGGLYNRKKFWRARLRVAGKDIEAYFPTEREAAEHYNKMATQHFGEFAKLNIFED